MVSPRVEGRRFFTVGAQAVQRAGELIIQAGQRGLGLGQLLFRFFLQGGHVHQLLGLGGGLVGQLLDLGGGLLGGLGGGLHLFQLVRQGSAVGLGGFFGFLLGSFQLVLGGLQLGGGLLGSLSGLSLRGVQLAGGGHGGGVGPGLGGFQLSLGGFGGQGGLGLGQLQSLFGFSLHILQLGGSSLGSLGSLSLHSFQLGGSLSLDGIQLSGGGSASVVSGSLTLFSLAVSAVCASASWVFKLPFLLARTPSATPAAIRRTIRQATTFFILVSSFLISLMHKLFRSFI